MNTYKRHRFPPDIISYAVWFYHRFNLSNRDVEDLLTEAGTAISERMPSFTIYSILGDISLGLITTDISGSVRSGNGKQ